MRIWRSMLREPHLTDGIGARIARNIPCTSTKDVLRDRILTFVTSAKQKKTSKIAQPKDLACYGEIVVKLCLWFLMPVSFYCLVLSALGSSNALLSSLECL
jgi:hypothetical protein